MVNPLHSSSSHNCCWNALIQGIDHSWQLGWKLPSFIALARFCRPSWPGAPYLSFESKMHFETGGWVCAVRARCGSFHFWVVCSQTVLVTTRPWPSLWFRTTHSRLIVPVEQKFHWSASSRKRWLTFQCFDFFCLKCFLLKWKRNKGPSEASQLKVIFTWFHVHRVWWPGSNLLHILRWNIANGPFIKWSLYLWRSKGCIESPNFLRQLD